MKCNLLLGSFLLSFVLVGGAYAEIEKDPEPGDTLLSQGDGVEIKRLSFLDRFKYLYNLGNGTMINSIKEEIDNSKAIIETLQKNVDEANALLSKIEKDQPSEMQKIVNRNEELAKMLAQLTDCREKLQKELAINKSAISQLELSVSEQKNNRIEIEKNNKAIGDMQGKFSTYMEISDVLIKYGNNPMGIPALHYAIKCSDEKAVKLLLEHGADPNAKDGKLQGEEQTALHYAVLAKNLKIADLLLKAGADKNVANGNGLSANDMVKESQDKSMIDLFAKSTVVTKKRTLHKKKVETKELEETTQS